MTADLKLRFPARAAASRIRIAPGGLDRLGAFTAGVTGARRAALVSDTRVAGLYGARALRSLRRAGLDAELVTVPPGERSKSVAALERLWRRFGAIGLGRRDCVVALGGGVIGDLAGFAAACWLRGVPWVCAPTSLLAQVDSSVGGKTAVDLAAGKNLVGAFHQPAGVLVDPDTLATLSPRHRRAGLAEVVKMGMAVDARLFRWAERHAAALAAGHPGALAAGVTRAIAAKARIVRGDEHEREGGLRSALNYGHTLGHAIEAAHGYRGPLHGEAVAIGMRAAAALSVRLAGLAPEARTAQDALLDAFSLPRRMPSTDLGALLEAIARDKKRARGGARWVLTTRVGHASVPRLISGRLVRAVLLEAGARA
ncbi:MAG: 3-dehydroquinate synthase [Candidatus Eisenbacteria bacterium RBG_16_71_46]|nr:MAG: 3-dehydroquinate synthase [Candidatus Eisenbacteria bacterium RBG_16_71_46]